MGAACGRTGPARGEGSPSWVAGAGSSAFSGEGSAGPRAGLWGGVIVGAALGGGGRRTRDLSSSRGRVSQGRPAQEEGLCGLCGSACLLPRGLAGAGSPEGPGSPARE